MKKNFNVEKEIDIITNGIKDFFTEELNIGSKAVIGISGGKDSTIAAALLVKALGADRVYGVLMPNGEQHDLITAMEVCTYLGIEYSVVNIKDICDQIYTTIPIVAENINVKINTPPRVRMTILYAYAAALNGRVINTSNRSERYIGYFTKYGDGAGDFAILKCYTATEVIAIGHALGIPDKYVDKTPEDGLSGKTDEEKLGFTYEELDNYILDKEYYPNISTLEKIKHLSTISSHKRSLMRSVWNDKVCHLVKKYC